MSGNKYPFLDKALEDLRWPSTLFDPKPEFAIIYRNEIKPSFWRHPIKWCKWRPQPIAYVDFGDGIDFSKDDRLTIHWGMPDGYATITTDKSGEEDE